MIILLTGQPRHGKSQYAIKLLLDFIKDNKKRETSGKLARDIYCNIAGVNDANTKTKLIDVLNQDEVFKDKKLWFGEHKDCPEGYVCPPKAAVFIYDESHKLDWIKERSGALSNDPTCISMNEHGHEDYIFIFITQFPQYIHTHLRGLIEFHYHVKRRFGAPSARVYKFNEFVLNPRSDTNLKDAFEKEHFKFSAKYQNCYQSASAHDSMKLTIPKPLIYAFLGIVALFLLTANQFLKSPLKRQIEAVQAQKGQGTTTVTAVAQPKLQQQAQAQVPSAGFDDALKSKYLDAYNVETMHDDTVRAQAVLYDSTTCVAYNKYGDKLNIDSQLCKKLARDGVPKAVVEQDSNAVATPDNRS